MFKAITYFLFYLTSLVLIGCSQQLQQAQNNISTTNNNNDKGYLLLAIENNALIEEINIWGLTQLNFQPKNGLTGDTFILAEVPTGHYRFNKVKTGMSELPLQSKYDWSFEIEKNVINYVGHLAIKQDVLSYSASRYSIAIVNKSSFALEYLIKEQATLLASQTVVYQGPGEDEFIAFVMANYLNKAQNNNQGAIK